MLAALHRAQNQVYFNPTVKLVKVYCDVYTETSSILSVCIDGRFVFIPRNDVDEISLRERSDQRDDGGYRGFIVIPKKLAEELQLPFVDVR
mgnify:FL=1